MSARTAKGSKTKTGERAGPEKKGEIRLAPALLKRSLLWIVPAAILWLLLTPLYNRFLINATENLLRLSESPSVTRLSAQETHYAVITRTDRPTSDGILGSFRVTDVHFPLLLLWTLFLAVPGVPLRKRLENVGWASLFLVFFHLADSFLWVKFVYATQLGAWSMENYGPIARNAWGLAKHVADLPIKFGLPLGLWVAFYYRRLRPRTPADSGR